MRGPEVNQSSIYSTHFWHTYDPATGRGLTKWTGSGPVGVHGYILIHLVAVRRDDLEHIVCCLEQNVAIYDGYPRQQKLVGKKLHPQIAMLYGPAAAQFTQ